MGAIPPPVIIEAGPKGPRLRIVRTTDALSGAEARTLARELDEMAEEIDPTPHAEAYRATAQAHHAISEGDLEVDENARISAGADDGAYVEAWIWVSMQDAGIADRCDECDAMIPSTSDEEDRGSIENKHHKPSCSLYNAEKA